MKGFHHSDGSQRVYLNGLANLIPYQRRAINGAKCADHGWVLEPADPSKWWVSVTLPLNSMECRKSYVGRPKQFQSLNQLRGGM